jgi:hypothetical protein
MTVCCVIDEVKSQKSEAFRVVVVQFSMAFDEVRLKIWRGTGQGARASEGDEAYNLYYQ